MTVPVALRTVFNFLVLYIIPNEDGYTITDDGSMLEDYSRTGSCFNVFTERYPNENYGIVHNNSFFYKEYPNDYNVRMAIDDFVHFFAAFDVFAAEYIEDGLVDCDDGGEGNDEGDGE